MISQRFARTLLFAAAALLLPRGAFAQDSPEVGPQPEPQVSPRLVDRIVAIVDEEPILQSDLEREIESYKFEAESFGRPIPEDGAELRKEVLDRLVEVKLLVAQAKLDGFVIGEEELQAETGRALQEIIDRYGTRAALDRDLRSSGMSFADLEARTRERVRNRLYTMRMISAHVRPEVEVLDNEVREFYQENIDRVPRKPAEVTIGNILVVPQPSEDVQERLRGELGEIRTALEGGMSFEDAAKKFSQGPNAARGGLVGTFKRGDLFSPVLDQAAWELEIGEVSDPIHTELGVHLIRVDERTDTEATLRQIMLRVETTAQNKADARARAEEVVRLARAGQDFAELAKKYSDDPGTREKGGLLGTFPEGQLSEQFSRALEGLAPGDVADPQQGAAGWFVLKLVDRTEGGVYSFDEVRPRLRGMLEDQRTQEKLDEFLQELRQHFYIEVKA